jgi:hypothetical protein
MLLLRGGLVALAAGISVAVDYASADAAELFEIAAVLVEGGLEVGVAGSSGSVAGRVVFVRMIRGF